MKRSAMALGVLLAAAVLARADEGSRNRPERLEWFRDAGFGMFIHWSLDVQVGSVISHSLVGASEDYARRFFELLPATFHPRKFQPADWAALARQAGMKYVVFTTKHHSGFCMYDTKTTPFGIMNTPFKRDATAEILKAFRDQGIAAGVYFSPDDFHYLHRNGKPMARAPHPGVTPKENPGLMELDRAQLRELFRNYGPIDVAFLDGPAEGLREVCWEEQPDVVVTRGAIETPEQRIPGVPLDRPWEACLTMGTQWHYKPTHETYKSGPELIEILIETRAKGGNLLLNVGPKPDGELPIEQEERLREIALWNMVNGEAIETVRPWVITNEGNVWFTKKKDEDTVYAFLTRTPWVMGERKSFTLKSVQVTDASRVAVLGHDGKILEYRPDVDPAPKWRQEEDGLHVSVMMGQRIYNDRRWPNPMVLKITGAKPALSPPVVVTGAATRQPQGASAVLRGELKDLGRAEAVEVGFQYRRRKRTEELYSKDAGWTDTALQRRSEAGSFTAQITGLEPEETYEFRATVRHPIITVHGEDLPVAAAREP